MTDQDVRDLLRARAADATPSPDGWERIAERIATGEPAPVIELDERRRLWHLPPVVLSAIAAAVLVLVGAVVLLQDDEGDQRLRAADDGQSENRDPAAATGIYAGALPIWPATTPDGLVALQAEADAGLGGELLDPRSTAAGYLSERLADPDRPGPLVQQFSVGQFESTGARRGEVVYDSPPGTRAGTIFLRQHDAEAAIWFVTGVASGRVDVHDLSYDGARVTGQASAGARGSLTVRVGPTDGDVATGELSQAVTPDEPVRLDQRISGTTGVIVQVRLTEEPSGRVSLAEVRIDKVVDGPAPSQSTFESAAEQAARRWIRAAATGDLDTAWATLAPASQEAVGSRARLENRRTELAEGWGAWDGAEGVTLRVVDLMAADGGSEEIPAEIPHFGVAILSGAIAQEGTSTFRAVSLPVLGTGAGAQVDPFVQVGIEVDGEAPPGVRTNPDGTLGAYTPAMARVWFLLDGRAPAPPDLLEGADGDQQHATFTPGPPLTEGPHAFTVVVLTVDGRIASRSTTVMVAGRASEPLECGMVGFTPNSEDVAGAITARGTTCEEALRFVELAGRETSSGGPQEVDVDGYHCIRTASTEDPLPVSSYRCTKGTITITFDRS